MFFYLGFITFAFWLAISQYKIDENSHNKLEEFFADLKLNKKSRCYIVAFLLRRLIYATVMITLASSVSFKVINIIASAQLLYFIYLAILRPFEESKSNIVEIINELFLFIIFCPLVFLRTKNNWNPTKISLYVWVIFSNSVVIFLIIFSKWFG